MTSKFKTMLVLLNLKFEISIHNWNSQPSRLQYLFAHAFEKHDRKWSEKIQNVLENVFYVTKSKFTTVCQRLEYWMLIVQPWSTDEWNIASTPLALAWSCSPTRWDPACCWTVVEVEVGVFICLTWANWLQSRRWTFSGLWLYWRTDAGSAWPVSSEIVTGSLKLLKLWIAVLRPVVGAKWPSSLFAICVMFFIIEAIPSFFNVTFLYHTLLLGESMACR